MKKISVIIFRVHTIEKAVPLWKCARNIPRPIESPADTLACWLCQKKDQRCSPKGRGSRLQGGRVREQRQLPRNGLNQFASWGPRTGASVGRVWSVPRRPMPFRVALTPTYQTRPDRKRIDIPGHVWASHPGRLDFSGLARTPFTRETPQSSLILIGINTAKLLD